MKKARRRGQRRGQTLREEIKVDDGYDECFNAQEDCSTLEFSHTYSLFLARLPDD